MVVFGVVIGLLVAGIAGTLLGYGVFETGTFDTFRGVLTGIWAAWPFFGVDKRFPDGSRCAAPPWWLLGLTACALIGTLADVQKSVSRVIQEVHANPVTLTAERANRMEQRRQLDRELKDWSHFKESHDL